jgi:hypothetical protein
MKGTRPTISEVVVDLLTRNHAVHQHIRMGLINYHALAARIKPTVDRATQRDVNVNTIVVIIKRFSDAQSKLGLPPTMSVLRNSKMTLSSGVVDVTITPKREAFINELKALVELSSELNERPHIFPLVSSIKIIADANDYGKQKAALKSRYPIKPRLNAAKITIHLSEEAERSPGIAAYITDLLYRNGINIVDAFLGYDDIILVLNESDGPRAYTILEEATREEPRARKSNKRT